MDIDVNIEGIKDLQAKVAALPPLVEAKVVGHGLAAAARVSAKRARRIAPVSTKAKGDGEKHLNKTIRVKRRWWKFIPGGKRIPRSAADLLAGGKGARHAHLVELGTVKTAANPFIQNAVRDSRGQQHNAMVVEVSKLMRRAFQEIASGKVSRTVRSVFGS